jgi:hypothetical protein
MLVDMTTNSAEHAITRSGPQDQQWRATLMAARHGHALRTAERACCCSSRPVVVAVMPPSPDRDHPTDLMFCAHHYRAARGALAASGATVFDQDGRPVVPCSPAV